MYFLRLVWCEHSTASVKIEIIYSVYYVYIYHIFVFLCAFCAVQVMNRL